MLMNDNEILLEISNKISNIDNSLTFFNNTFVICLGIICAIFVCYLMYKIVDKFISF